MKNLETLRNQVEQSLATLPELTRLSPRLKAACLHSLFPGGKRIRPVGALAIATDLKPDVTQDVEAACALELIHCSSLIHDDLPALDNDDIRRGRPTVHKAFDEATAVLAGDALLTASFAVLSRTPEIVAIHLTRSLSVAFLDVCDGQQLDIEQGEGRVDVETIHAKKTGALFGATFQFGLILGGIFDRETLKTAERVGESYGVLFQMIDDFLDQYGDPKLRGRPSGSDIKNGRATMLAEGRDALASAIAKRQNEFTRMWEGLEGNVDCTLNFGREALLRYVSDALN